jgi:hypothetical protein
MRTGRAFAQFVETVGTSLLAGHVGLFYNESISASTA